MAGPTWQREPNPFAADAQPLVILLKADKSMLATDPSPSRLARAQLKVADLAKARQGQPLALIAYAGSAHLVLPSTRDTEVVAQMAAEISPAVMPEPGDRLDLAVQEAAKLLQQEQGGGSLLIIADSAESDPQRLAAARQAAAGLPIQILALTAADAPETQSLRAAAQQLGATLQLLTPDDTDVRQMVAFAERRSSLGIDGESSRWQETGYWLTPCLALIVALSFRRETAATGEPG